MENRPHSTRKRRRASLAVPFPCSVCMMRLLSLSKLDHKLDGYRLRQSSGKMGILWQEKGASAPLRGRVMTQMLVRFGLTMMQKDRQSWVLACGECPQTTERRTFHVSLGFDKPERRNGLERPAVSSSFDLPCSQPKPEGESLVASGHRF